MRSTWFSRAARAAAACALLLAGIAVTLAAARPERPVRPRAVSLFSSSGYLFQVNRQQCGLDNIGHICVQYSGSPVTGGGFWPKGTPDEYIFWSGLQLAGIVNRTSGFPWAGDTIGAYFVDFRGGQEPGDPPPVTPGGVFTSLNTDDLANWPNGGIVRDATIYNSVLLGRKFISQGDAWVRYWEGNPTFLSGRSHPMGILVDQRVVAWNFPSGNEDIIYAIYTFYNVTARASSGAYTNPTVDPALTADIGAIGDAFQDQNEAKFKIDIPDGGYSIDSLYAAFAIDGDVANAGKNYATAVLPFNLGLEYASDFTPAPGWTFPPAIFGAPFFPAVGFIGIKFLKSPVGLTMFSQTLNPNTPVGLTDAKGVNQLWRYLAGFIGPSDVPCSPYTSSAVARAKRLCFLGQAAGDARFYQSSGPFSLPPGEARSIVVAYINAAPVAAPLIAAGGVGTDLPPGVPGQPDSLALAPATYVRPIDKITGWISATDNNPADGQIEQNEVTTVPRSLLDKALKAQAVFDNKFLLPFAPDAPVFYLVPGDNQVTVVWQKSATEDLVTGGDPFFAIASNASSPLYDPDFRHFDVEGYRIYRGQTSSDLKLLIQYDYSGTTFVDYTGQIDYGDQNGDGLVQCAPELGLQQDCPVTFAANPIVGTSPNFETDIVDPLLVQVLPGDRVQLANTSVLNLKADTAVINQQCGDVVCPPLTNSGVPFVYIDKTVRNSFTYFYAVTAFDVNSAKSGPTSLESPRVTQRVSPRRTGTNQIAATPFSFPLVGDNNDTARGSPPTIDPVKGTFSGPAAPTPNLFGLVDIFADQLLQPNFGTTLHIDSVVPGATATQVATYYLTQTTSVVGGPDAVTKLTFGPVGSVGEEDGTTPDVLDVAVPVRDAALAVALGLGGLPSSARLQSHLVVGPEVFASKDIDWHVDVEGSFFGNQDPRLHPSATVFHNEGGSRWFDGANETAADPTLGQAHGTLTGVTAICRPVRSHPCGPGTTDSVNALFRRFDQVTRQLTRGADIKFYWGTTAGTVDSVVDVTHHVRVPFDPQNRASYGFRNDVVGTRIGSVTAPDGLVTYVDFLQGACLFGASGISNTGCLTRGYVNAATLGSVNVTGDTLASGQFVNQGTGFGIYVNGEPFIFQTAALPVKPAVWTYRSYFGLVTKGTSGYAFTQKPANPAVTGLNLTARTGNPASYPTNPKNAVLTRVHTVPDPYYVSDALEVTANSKILKFVNLPNQAIIRIYSTSGILVAVVAHNDPAGGGEETWNLRNRNNQFVASGVYFYHIETPGGQTKIGRFTVVNFAP